MTEKKKAIPKPADTTAPGPEPKSTEEVNQESLLEIVQAQAETIRKQDQQLEDFADLVNSMREQIAAREASGETVEREADVFIDEFTDSNALKFKKDYIDKDSNFEFGRKLKWINPKLRDEIGMRGWEPVRMGDSFLEGEVKDLDTGEVRMEPGAKLGEYINAVPSRMEGGARRDDYIRRGDLILCWIDMKTWIARMRNRDEVAMKKRIQLTNEGDAYDVKGRRGAHVLGPGLTRGGDPRRQPSAPKSRYMPPNLDPELGNLHEQRQDIPVEPTPSPEE